MVLLTLAGLPAWAAPSPLPVVVDLPAIVQRGELRIGADPSAGEPYFWTAGSKPMGFEADLGMAIAKKLGIPRERVADDIIHAGNTSSASIPLALSRMAEQGRLQPGTPALLIAFGAGLSYASQVITVP